MRLDKQTRNGQSQTRTLSTRLNIFFAKTLIVFAFFFTGITKVSAQNPVANFSANVTSGCAPLTVSFLDLSSGSPTSWNWEFSNGTLSSVQNPVVSFSQPGTYSVKLVVQNANGIGQLERIDYITVFPSPSLNFTADLTLGCVPSTVHFTDLSTSPGGTITAWDWDFGDGATSNQQNPSHTYTNIGFYAVTLSVTSSTGCKATATRASYIRIVGGIDTDFGYTLPSTCQGPYTVSFQNQSGGPGNISYTWDFGNSQTSTAQNPVTTYPGPGTYTVQLNAQSDLGCSGSKQKTITITSTTTNFTAPPTINSNPANIATYQWTIGGTVLGGTGRSVSHSLTTNGTYDVTLTITDNNGCITTRTLPNYISVDGPLANFIPSSPGACLNKSVSFTDLSTSNAAINNWHFDFGDGTQQDFTSAPFTHTYGLLGGYTVSLTVTDVNGCSSAYSLPTDLLVTQPKAGFRADTVFCPGRPLSFIDSSSGAGLTYLWNFGDGGNSTLANPTHSFPLGDADYTIKLKIRDADHAMQSKYQETIAGAMYGMKIGPQ
ncbi:PKD domain protein, partial [Ostertagia ostertagi]